VAQAPLLSCIDCLRGAASAQRSPGLDFDEHEQRSASRDDIHLDAIGANVPRNDAIPSRFEETSRDGFAGLAETLALGCHVRPFSTWPGPDPVINRTGAERC
jgi:hypothetical protein